MRIRRFSRLLVAVLVFVLNASAQEARPTFKVLRIPDSYMVERRVTALGGAGYRIVALGVEAKGYIPIITLRLNPGHKYEYALITGGKEFEQSLNKAGASGFRLRRELMFDYSGKSTVFVERTDETDRKFEYHIIKPFAPGKIPHLSLEALAQGFTQVAPMSYGGIWEREAGAPASSGHIDLEAKLLMPTSNLEKLADRFSKEGHEGFRMFAPNDVAPIAIRAKGEQKRFDYRVVRATIPVDFEQKLAAAQAQGFKFIAGTFRIGPDGITAIVESTGEPVEQVKYTMERRVNGVLATANPREIVGCAPSSEGLWYLLADAAAPGRGKVAEQTAPPPNTRRIQLRDKMEVTFDDARLYVSTESAHWAIPREALIEAIYMRGRPLTEGPGFSTPIIVAGPDPVGGIISLASLAVHGVSSGISDVSEEHMELVWDAGETEFASTLKADAKNLPALKAEMTTFAGSRFIDLAK